MAKFAMMFSAGKDSAMALHKMIEAGNEPALLITAVKNDTGASYMHSIPENVLEEYSRALDIPIMILKGKFEDKDPVMVSALLEAKEQYGITQVCFGDIAMEREKAWETARCHDAGLEAVFPLWGVDVDAYIREFLSLSYKCIIKSVLPDYLPERFLERTFDASLVKELKALGVDPCGERGEFHTIVVDGPIFKRPLRYKLGGHFQDWIRIAVTLECV